MRVALEDVLFDQRAGRDDAHDVAAHELVRHRRFELLGERDDAPLRDELGEIAVERVMRNARHRDAPPAARFFRGERDRERARDRLGVLAVRFVEIADAREQDRFGITVLHPEVLLEHRRPRHGRRHPSRDRIRAVPETDVALPVEKTVHNLGAHHRPPSSRAAPMSA